MVNSAPQLFLKAAQYVEENPTMPNAHVGSSLFPLERVGGFAFGVILSHGDETDADTFRQTVTHHLERLGQTMEEGVNMTHRFEQLLQAMNEELARAWQENTLRLPIAEASGIVGVASGSEVILSGFGQLTAQFLHKTRKEQFELYDLTRSMRVEDEAPTWQKPFLTVLNGELHAGDVFYLGTRLNRHDVNQNTLNEILTTLPPTSAVSKIRQHLPLETAFAAIILRAERVESAPEMAGTVEQSLEQLHGTKEQTARYLGDQTADVGSSLHKAWLLLFPRRGAGARAKLLRRSTRFSLRLLLTTLVIGFALMRDVARASLRALYTGVTHPRSIVKNVQRTRSRVDASVRTGIHVFNRLPKTSKRILLITLVVLSLFIVSLFFINKQQARKAETRAYEESREEVQSELDTAEASLIYGDEQQARAFLLKARELVAILDQSTEERVARAAELLKEVEAMEATLRHEKAVEPMVVSKAADEIFGPEVTVESLGLAREGVDVAVYNGKAYLLSPDLNQIFKHNRSGEGFDGGAAWILSNSTNIGDATAIVIDGFVWVLKADGTMVKYLSGREETFTLASVDPALLNATELWTDESSPYLYVVDPNQKRLLVFEKENGSLMVQYTSPVFEFLRRVKADEANKTIYVEAATTVYQFTSTSP